MKKRRKLSHRFRHCNSISRKLLATLKIASLGNKYISISKQKGKTPCLLNLFKALRCESYNTLAVCLHN